MHTCIYIYTNYFKTNSMNTLLSNGITTFVLCSCITCFKDNIVEYFVSVYLQSDITVIRPEVLNCFAITIVPLNF